MSWSKLESVLIGLVLAASMMILGCSGVPPKYDESDVGTLSAALVATGSDGAEYAFLPGQSLVVENSTFAAFIPLDGAEAAIFETLPVGSFTASFSPGAPLRLERTLDGTTMLVDATLLNPQPISFDIAENQITPLALHMQVEGLADVVFSVGQLLVTLDVQRTEVQTGSSVAIQGTTTVNSVGFGASATAEAQSLLAVTTGQVVDFGLVFTTTGDWHLTRPAQACVDGQLTSASFPPSAPGFGARLAEMLGGNGTWCVFDAGTTDSAELSVTSSVTPPEQQAALPSSYSFSLVVGGQLAGDVFDGVNLAQSALESPMSLGTGVLEHRVFDLVAQEFTTQLAGSMSGTVQVSP